MRESCRRLAYLYRVQMFVFYIELGRSSNGILYGWMDILMSHFVIWRLCHPVLVMKRETGQQLIGI